MENEKPKRGRPSQQKEDAVEQGSMTVTINTPNGPTQMPLSELLAILSQNQAMIRSSAMSGLPVNYTDQRQAEDYLGDPVVFLSVRTKYTDYGCQRADNTYHLPPYRTPEGKVEPIEFRLSHTELRQSGIMANGTIGIEPIRYCTYVCRDKKILDYLRSHPLLNIEFFENSAKTISKDIVRSQAVRDAAAQVNMMNTHQIMERMIHLGITPTQDIEQNRDALISKIADDVIGAQKKTLDAALPLRGNAGLDPRKSVFESKEQADSALREITELASASDNFVS